MITFSGYQPTVQFGNLGNTDAKPPIGALLRQAQDAHGEYPDELLCAVKSHLDAAQRVVTGPKSVKIDPSNPKYTALVKEIDAEVPGLLDAMYARQDSLLRNMKDLRLQPTHGVPFDLGLESPDGDVYFGARGNGHEGGTGNKPNRRNPPTKKDAEINPH